MTGDESSIRVGVVGCGRVARQRHLPVVAALRGVELVAVSDVDGDKTRDVAKAYGLSEAYEDYRELVASPRVDAVMVATPTPLHADVGVAALQSGKHVMIEKPVALSLPAVDLLRDSQARSGRTVAVAMNSRWHRLARRAREVIRSGSLGPIGLVRSAFTDDFRLGDTVPPWGLRHDLAGCVLVETAVHHFDLWQFLLDSSIEEVHATMRDPMTVDERAAVTATMSNGVIVSAMFTEGLKGANELEIYGQDGRLRLSLYDFDGLDVSPRSEYPGTMGVRLRRLKQFLAEFPGAVRRRRTGGDWAGSYRTEWEHFVDCIRTGRQPECGLEEGASALRVALAAMASLARGTAVRVSDAPPTIVPYRG